jgi:hypothetical protein
MEEGGADGLFGGESLMFALGDVNKNKKVV